MIHLYHCADARSFRPLWAMEEMGLGYELTVLPFPPRYQVAEQVGLDARFTPAIAAYWAKLQVRGGFKAAKSAQVTNAPVSAEASHV